MNFTAEEYRIILAAEKAIKAANKARESARKRVVTPEQLQKLTEDRLAYQTKKAEYSRQNEKLVKDIREISEARKILVDAKSILFEDWFNTRKSFQCECSHEFSGPNCIHCDYHMYDPAPHMR